MRRLLRIDETGPKLPETELRSAFSRSMVVSGTRCLLTYLVIPFVFPLLGLTDAVGPVIGVPLGVLAIVFNVKSMRRFWRADHRWRWGYTAISATVIVMVMALIAIDLADLLS